MIKKIKRVIGKRDNSSLIYKIFVFINLLIFHFNERAHKESFGELNPNKNFYIIRPNGETEGILSAYLNVLKLYNQKKQEGYEVVIDYENFKNQYSLGCIKGKANSWEYFFSQPSKYSLKDVYSSKNVYFSGWSITSVFKKRECLTFDDEIKMFQNLKYTIPYNHFLDELASDFFSKKITTNTLGVFIRGTDYVALKPKNHYVQPSIEDVIKKINETKNIDQIYLVTEDNNIANIIEKNIDISIVRFSNGIDYDYDETKYLSEEINTSEKYTNTVNYLVSVLVLAKCPKIVSSITNATFFLNIIRNVDTSNDYYFNLGRY